MKKISVILEDSPSLNCSMILNALKKYSIIFHDLKEIYCIKHSNDTYLDGTPKRVHYHLIMYFNCDYAKNNLLQIIGGSLTCQLGVNYDLNKITIDSIKCWRSMVRYLIHKDDLSKYQYDINSIFTLPELYSTLHLYLEDTIRDSKLSLGDIFEICKNCNTISEMIIIIGYANYMKYRYVLEQFYEDRMFRKNIVCDFKD